VTRRRAGWLAVIWTAPSLAFLLLVHLVIGHYRIDVPPRLSDDARTAIADRLRAGFEKRDATLADVPELARRLPGRGPVTVQVWLDGAFQSRVDGYGDTIAEAVEAAAGLLPVDGRLALLDDAQRGRARLKIDVVVGRGILERRFPLLDLVTLHPGIDGLGVAVDGGEQILLPDDLIRLAVLTKKKPFAMVPDFALGLDTDKTDQVLAKRAGLSGPWKQVKPTWQAKQPHYFRLRTDSFVERRAESRADGPPLPLTRGIPAGPDATAENLRAAAIAGARYLVAHLGTEGRYVYEIDLATGQPKAGYSIPRHAGTTYFLAEVYRITKEEFLREPIERAFRHLEQLIEEGGCSGTLPDGEEIACVVDKGGKVSDLGSSALAVVALAEYQRATGASTFEKTAKKLAAWILMMQRPDGSFRHRYDIAKAAPDDKTQLLYFSGEATLALARMYTVTQDERYVRASERGIDWLVAWYDFFAGGWIYGEEHWTCISSEAIWPAVKKTSYLDFCNGYSRFLRDQQAGEGDFPSQQDLVGTYNVTPFVMPSNTPAGSRTEAMISTYKLGKNHGRPDKRILKQILMAAHYLLAQQIRPESDYAVAAKAVGLGAIPGNPVDASVRIDFVQHACSALIRASELIEPTPE
jgi:hypothetical protein